MTKIVLLCAMVLLIPARSQAALILAGSINGGTLFCATDNNALCGFGAQISDLNPTIGILDLGTTTIGGVLVEGSLHTANLGALLLNSSSLLIANTSGAPITLQASVSATDFVGPANIAFTTGSGTFVNAIGSSTTLTWWNDPANTQGGVTATDRPGDLVDTFTYLAALALDSFAHDGGPFPVSDLGLFSMTMGFDVTLLSEDTLISRGQSITKDFEVVIPEPGTLLLVGSLLGAVAWTLRKRLV